MSNSLSFFKRQPALLKPNLYPKLYPNYLLKQLFLILNYPLKLALLRILHIPILLAITTLALCNCSMYYYCNCKHNASINHVLAEYQYKEWSENMKKIVLTFLIIVLSSAAYAEENIETFAVVWDWTTADREQIGSKLGPQTNQLLDLWKKGVVENVYLNINSEFTDGETFPNVVFFINAENKEQAKNTLDGLIFVKNGISTYNIYPVGKLWLPKHEDFQKLHKDNQQRKD